MGSKTQTGAQPEKWECANCSRHHDVSFFDGRAVGVGGKVLEWKFEECIVCREYKQFIQRVVIEPLPKRLAILSNEFWPVGNDKILKDMEKRLEQLNVDA